MKNHPEKRPYPYWRQCLGQLHDAYQGICAYLCIYIPRAVGSTTVDHFVAKSSPPNHGSTAIVDGNMVALASDPRGVYEWSNYRLACSLMNSRKGQFDDVLDPFKIENGWFQLELSGLQVIPGDNLDEQTRRLVEQTICRLRLNDDECRMARAELFDAYMNGDVSSRHFERYSPFVAMETKRQNLTRT